jgi:hypothetical protein
MIELPPIQEPSALALLPDLNRRHLRCRLASAWRVAGVSSPSLAVPLAKTFLHANACVARELHRGGWVSSPTRRVGKDSFAWRLRGPAEKNRARILSGK